MKAALYKDLITSWKYLLVLGVLTAALGTLGIRTGQPLIFTLLFPLAGMLYFTFIFARNAENKVNRTLLAGPTTRNQLVTLNYAITVVLGIVAFVTCGLVIWLMNRVSLEEAILFASCSFASTVLLISIHLPMFYKFGAERAKLFLLVVMISLLIARPLFADKILRVLPWFTQASTLPALLNATLLLGVALLLTAVSLQASKKIMSSHEF